MQLWQKLFPQLEPRNAAGKKKSFVEYSSQGRLVPDEPTIKLWQRYVRGLTASGRFHPKHDTLVLDGIPRNVHQAEMLDDFLNVTAVFLYAKRQC